MAYARSFGAPHPELSVPVTGDWEETDFGIRAGQEAQFMKNIALAGACLFMFAIFNRFGDDLPGPTGPLF